MDPEQFARLLDAYQQNRLTPGEADEFRQAVNAGDQDPAIRDRMLALLETHGVHPHWNEEIREAIWERVREASQPRGRLLFPERFQRTVAAAASLLLLAIATWLLLRPHAPAPLASQQERFHNDIAPGHNTAILTLASGQKIALDSAATGLVAQQGNSTIQKLAAGQLTYKNGSPQSRQSFNPLNPGLILVNTLTTPRGGQYQLKLPDGSIIWLNAASSVRYPTAFTGPDRVVDITGEAYLEITPDKHKPFRVRIDNGPEIEVLGTSFDINAYADEPEIKTTLVTGAINLRAGGRLIKLSPGDQARTHAGATSVRPGADLQETLAWKDGRFEFNGNIQGIMRQMARWYNIDVDYEDNITDRSFGGAISRKENISEVLKFLELTGSIHFKLTGKKLTVMK